MRTRSFNEEDSGILEILKSVDKIYAEDTRTSGVLLSHYGIKTKLESYHNFNQDEKTLDVVREIRNGMKIALISDAGLPVISDPGYKIVAKAREEGLRVSTIPGASAGISALIASGIAPMPYTFYGFLDSKSSKRKEELKDLKYLKSTLIFYEAPHRIHETLSDMEEILGDRYCCLARELTKTYEEFITGAISSINKEEYKGEMVVIVEGYKEDNTLVDDPNKKIDEMISLGYKPNDAIKEVAKMFNLDRKELYKNYTFYKNNRGE